jgi:hypothetical protein
MFVLRGLSVAFSLSIAVVARPTSQVNYEKSVAEKLEVPPIGWVQDVSEKVDKDVTSITLKIHLVNKNMDKFHEHAMNVSIVGSERDLGVMLMLYADCNTRPCFVWSAHVSRKHSRHDCT